MTAPDRLSRPWIQTYSGQAFPLLDPRPDDVSLRDIAESLAKLNRFTGHTRWPYSVAQHSLLVADIVLALGRRDAEPYALLHDAKEAYIGDVATPIKRAMIALGGTDVLDQIEGPIDRAIHEAFDLTWPAFPDVQAIVRHADMVALATERRDVLLDGPASGLPWGRMPDPMPERIDQQPWHWQDAAERFHRRAIKLGLRR